jgi:hypothetical protein
MNKTKIERDAERVAANIKARIATNPQFQLTEKEKRHIERIRQIANEAGLNPYAYRSDTPIWMCKFDAFCLKVGNFLVLFRPLLALVCLGVSILYGIYNLLMSAKWF